MPDRELPARPNLNQYKKQAKDLVREFDKGVSDARTRVTRHHPHPSDSFRLTDAQLVIAREHGFESWPKFAGHIEMLQMIEATASIEDPVATFIEVATVPRHAGHGSGSLEHAEMILARYPEVGGSNIFVAAILADEVALRGFLAQDLRSATTTGGPRNWDALTYLCFSRYLRLDPARSAAFVRCARALLDGGASANTGWVETIDHPNPRRIRESAIYGAAGIARNAELTQLLLDYGADPNDEETPYHAPEGYDNSVMAILLKSGKLNEESLVCMLVRKADWHDMEGMRMVLQSHAKANTVSRWAYSGLQHAIRRDNSLQAIELLLDYGTDPAMKNARDGRSATAMAARRGRGDILRLLEQRGFPSELQGSDQIIAECALGNSQEAQRLAAGDGRAEEDVLADGGTLLAEFAGNGNVEGLRCLLALGISVRARYKEGDIYFDIAKESIALHVAAWRAWPLVVRELIARGADVNEPDVKGRTPLFLAVKACVDSYWMWRRSPESVAALLQAGASVDGIEIPSGYDEVDELIKAFRPR